MESNEYSNSQENMAHSFDITMRVCGMEFVVMCYTTFGVYVARVVSKDLTGIIKSSDKSMEDAIQKLKESLEKRFKPYGEAEKVRKYHLRWVDKLCGVK